MNTEQLTRTGDLTYATAAGQCHPISPPTFYSDAPQSKAGVEGPFSHPLIHPATNSTEIAEWSALRNSKTIAEALDLKRPTPDEVLRKDGAWVGNPAVEDEPLVTAGQVFWVAIAVLASSVLAMVIAERIFPAMNGWLL